MTVTDDQGKSSMPVPLPRSAPGGKTAPEGSSPSASRRDSAAQSAPSGSPVKLSVLMCAYNEEHTIVRAVGEVLGQQYPCDMELIVVDDGSADATPTLLALIEDPRLIVHHHREKRSRGAALTMATALASGTHILPFNADLEYSAEDILKIAEPVLKRRCNVVYGTRLFGYNTVYQSYRHALGNRILTGIMNILFNSCFSDLHACLKLVPLGVVRDFNLRETGFGLDTELTAMLLRTGERPFEVPISYYSGMHSHGKKQWRKMVSYLGILWRVRLTRVKRLKAPADRCRSSPRPMTPAFPEVVGRHRGDALADVPDADRRGQHSLMPQPRNPWQVSVDVGRNRPLCPRPDDLLMLVELMGGATYPRCLVQLPDKTVPNTVI